jgi:hypothetical protein
MRKYSHKVDSNQAEIVRALRDIGASVLVLSRVGRGCADLAVGFRGLTYFLEIKNDKGKLTPAEQEFMEEWNGHYAIVRTVDEALAAIGAVDDYEYEGEGLA